jgi:ABC-2 type transport system ATP-binding protein
MVWFCGGHGACISTRNDGVMVKRATIDWLDRYVKSDLTVDTGPQFEWVGQHGTQFSSNAYPVQQGTSIVVSSTKGGVLPLLPFIGRSGPELRILTAGPIGALLGIPSGSSGIGQPRHAGAGAGDVGRRDAHDLGADGDGDAEADHVAGCAECGVAPRLR